ncbi:MAG: type II secretion system protein [Candidatus Saganbacteria bacterium]|nr:type II secretion system protein [Candidatus Saganbacteria bacterium]
MKRKKGFTLIELLVVIGIIGMLAAFLLPTFVGVQDKAKEAGVKSVMHSVQLAVESYNMENETFPIATEIPIKTLYENYLSAIGYTTVPKNPFTGKAYAASDTAGKIIYTYDAAKNGYTITGYKKNGTSKVQELTNLD